MYGVVFCRTSAPLQHRLRRDPVRDVDHARVGRDPRDHAVARADEVVLEPEVGEERDHASLGGVHQIADGGDEPIEVVGRRPPRRRVSPSRRATRDVSAPIVTAGSCPPIAA